MPFVALLRRRIEQARRARRCQGAVELMTEYLEGAMSPSTRRRFEAHLEECQACTAYLDQMRATVATLGHLDPVTLPDAVLDELVAVYRRMRPSA